MPSVPLSDLAARLHSELRVAEIPDYAGAWNGLQLANASGSVNKVAAAVDACLPVIEAAVQSGAQLLLVHHGLFWSGVQMTAGGVFRKLKLAMDHDLAIYSAHLPLDVHPLLGNNARLAAACGFTGGEPFGDWKGMPVGLRFATEMPRETLTESIAAATGGARVHVCPAGPAIIRSVGIVTGGAGSEVAAAASAGLDAFITGEGPHWSYTLAEELGINLFYAGHYATETFGVKALADWAAQEFGLPWEFVDHPTGL